MPLLVNIQQLARNAQTLKGELEIADLELGMNDPVAQANDPLEYELEVEMLEQAVLARGRLRLKLDCQCVRCLKPFAIQLKLDGWACHLPLEGEDAVPVANDSVDLTPHIREDILLAFPQHPVCKPECGGLRGASVGKAGKPSGATAGLPSSAMDQLNKLKL